MTTAVTQAIEAPFAALGFLTALTIYIGLRGKRRQKRRQRNANPDNHQ